MLGSDPGGIFASGNGLSSLRSRIVSIAESQVGYRSDPSDTYCNKYSAYWNVGSSDCGNSNLDEEWCADFAAWVWEKAGAVVAYHDQSGDINQAAASFYLWGLNHNTWHPVGSGYIPQPGDVAIYGLNASTVQADHVAIVIASPSGDQRGPTAVNGDGDRTGFSVVELDNDEWRSVAHGGHGGLSGYVSPTDPSTTPGDSGDSGDTGDPGAAGG